MNATRRLTGLAHLWPCALFLAALPALMPRQPHRQQAARIRRLASNNTRWRSTTLIKLRR